MTNTRFVLASNNAKKLAELKEILSELGIDVISMREADIEVEIDECGSTFEENAIIKAETVMKLCRLPVIADDSGIVVDALGGAPGVLSARYGGDSTLSDTDRYMLLLRNMEGVEQRGAKFVASVVCCFPDGELLSAYGECEGVITEAPRGEGGFGYDPVFCLPEAGKTMAELTQTEKNKISHRAKALQELKKLLSIRG